MKHITCYRLLALVLATLFFLPATTQELPIDSDLRYGTLPGGMTYYIRHNAEPQGKAEFWMAYHVGSVQEEESERGLAHFLEHMAFNGTVHFDAGEMIHYLTANGISFGKDINASTSFEQTIYHISQVPTGRPALLDSVLLIMNDLGGGLMIPEEAIDKERRIIEEEWRSRSDYVMRMYEHVLPQLLGENCAYATRLPIGSMDVVRSAQRSDLAGFYRRWYRPSLQALIIVGDFDAGRMEQEVKRLFSATPDWTSATFTAPRVELKPGITYASFTDAEVPAAMAYLFMPHEPVPQAERNTLQEVRRHVVRKLACEMFNQRLREAALSPAQPLLGGTVTDGKFLIASSCDALTMAVVAKTDSLQSAMTMLLLEARRAQEHGFSQPEFQRTLQALETEYDGYLAEKDKRSSVDYVEEYIDHFLNGGYIPGVEKECALVKSQVSEVSLDEVNRYIRERIDLDNLSVLVTSPLDMKAQIPDAAMVQQCVAQARRAHTEPYADETRDEPLLTALPTPGRIVSEQNDPATGAVIFTLSNGATVYLLTTTHKNDEVLFGANSPGGYCTLDGRFPTELRMIDQAIENSSLGEWNQVSLQKRLSSTPLALYYTMGDYTDELLGICRPMDLELLLQLNYLYFTAMGPDENAYQALVQGMRSQIIGMKGQPEAVFADSVLTMLHNADPLYRPLTVTDLDTARYDRILDIYRERVACVADFSFMLVGNVDVATARPLIERYIASLPSTGPKDDVRAHRRQPLATGDHDCVFLTPMGTPKGSVCVYLMGDMDFDLRNQLMMEIFGQTLEIAANTHMREELHGTYGVEVDKALSLFDHKWNIVAKFDTQPEHTEQMVNALAQVVDMVLTYGVTSRALEKIKGQMLEEHRSQVHTNSYWYHVLQHRAFGVDVDTAWEETLQGITPEDMKTFVDRLKVTSRLRVIQQGY